MCLHNTRCCWFVVIPPHGYIIKTERLRPFTTQADNTTRADIYSAYIPDRYSHGW